MDLLPSAYTLSIQQQMLVLLPTHPEKLRQLRPWWNLVGKVAGTWVMDCRLLCESGVWTGTFWQSVNRRVRFLRCFLWCRWEWNYLDIIRSALVTVNICSHQSDIIVVISWHKSNPSPFAKTTSNWQAVLNHTYLISRFSRQDYS